MAYLCEGLPDHHMQNCNPQFHVPPYQDWDWDEASEELRAQTLKWPPINILQVQGGHVHNAEGFKGLFKSGP